MDGNIIANLMGTTGGSQSKAKQGKVDSDAFSACLDDATKTKNEANEQNKALVDDTKHDAKSEKERARKAAAKADQEEQLRQAQGKGPQTPAALRKLMSVNPDTLSTAERQSLRLGEFSSTHEAKTAQVKQQHVHSTVPHPVMLTQATPPVATPDKEKLSQRAQIEVAQRDEKVEEKREKSVREAAQEQPKGGQPGLEQMIARESSFTEEMGKARAAEQAKERQSLIDQILQKIEVRNFNNRTELNLKLNPEYLGELRVKLVHTADGGVTANFETTSRRTRKALQEAESELLTQAKDKGIRLGAMKVSLVEQV